MLYPRKEKITPFMTLAASDGQEDYNVAMYIEVT